MSYNLTDAYNLSDAYAISHNVTMPNPSVVYVYNYELIITLLLIIASCEAFRTVLLLWSMQNRSK